MQRIVFEKKILFKEVPDEELSFLQKTAAGCRGEVVLQDSFIHPDRQVYFFASFSQNEVEELHKYIVIDAETKKELQSGKSYHHYDNPYKKITHQLVGYFLFRHTH